jgi:hypothetical protein
VTGYERAIVRLYGAGAGRPTASLGLLVGRQQFVTCAHVVNTALGRSRREQTSRYHVHPVRGRCPEARGAATGIRVSQKPWLRAGGFAPVARFLRSENRPLHRAPRRHARVLARLDHDGVVNAVAFGPDGTRVITVSIDGSVRAFAVTPELLAWQAFEVMTRPLNSAELRWYSLPSDCRHVEEWNRRNKQHRPPVNG